MIEPRHSPADDIQAAIAALQKPPALQVSTACSCCGRPVFYGELFFWNDRCWHLACGLKTCEQVIDAGGYRNRIKLRITHA